MLAAQTSLMQALRETQNELSQTQKSMMIVLGEQGAALGTLILEIIKIQDRLKTIEREHSPKLDAHSAKLDEILTLLRRDDSG